MSEREKATWGEPYVCDQCGLAFVKGEECRVMHLDGKCCHEYEWTPEPHEWARYGKTPPADPEGTA